MSGAPTLIVGAVNDKAPVEVSPNVLPEFKFMAVVETMSVVVSEVDEMVDPFATMADPDDPNNIFWQLVLHI